MKPWSARIAIVATVTVTVAGCSSSSSSGSDGAAGSCGKVAACGGNLVGTWTIVAGCQSGAPSIPMNPACQSETVQSGPVTASGTATFNADMTYSVSLTETTTDTLVVPTSCLAQGGVTLTCDQLAGVLNNALSGDAGTATTCTTSGSSCNCPLTVSATRGPELGTYAVSGNTFTTTSSGTTGTPAGYCVQGNTLHVLATTMAMGASTTVDLVATKQ